MPFFFFFFFFGGAPSTYCCQGAEQPRPVLPAADADRAARVEPPADRIIRGWVEPAGLRAAALRVQDPDAVPGQVDVGRPQRQDLGDPQPRPVQQHEQRPVPDPARRPPRALADDRRHLVRAERLGRVFPVLVRRRLARALPEPRSRQNSTALCHKPYCIARRLAAEPSTAQKPYDFRPRRAKQDMRIHGIRDPAGPPCPPGRAEQDIHYYLVRPGPRVQAGASATRARHERRPPSRSTTRARSWPGSTGGRIPDGGGRDGLGGKVPSQGYAVFASERDCVRGDLESLGPVARSVQRF